MKALEIPERFTGTVYVCMWSDPAFCLYGDITLMNDDDATRIERECIEFKRGEGDEY